MVTVVTGRAGHGPRQPRPLLKPRLRGDSCHDRFNGRKENGDTGMGLFGHGAAFRLMIVCTTFMGILLPLCGCDSYDGIFCTAEYVPGICISVVDAVTGSPAACGATAWVIDDEYSDLLSDSCVPSQPDSLQSPVLRGAWERPGVYTVFITKLGYRPWSCGDVVVTEDRCHVRTVELEARLEPDTRDRGES